MWNPGNGFEVIIILALAQAGFHLGPVKFATWYFAHNQRALPPKDNDRRVNC